MGRQAFSGSTPQRRIVIVDDHPLVREGLAARINSESDLQVCGEAEGVASGWATVSKCRPDLAIIDLSLANGNGLELIKQITSEAPEVRVLVVSARDELLYAERCLRVGAAGYVSKQECHTEIIDAIRTVLEGNRYLSAAMTQRMLGRAVAARGLGSQDPMEKLSDRELEVFELIGQGKTTAAIARQLKISVHTVETHREKLRHKLGASNGTELMRLAVQWILEGQ